MNLYIFNSKSFKSFIVINFNILLLFLIVNILVRYSLDTQLMYSYRSEIQVSNLTGNVYDFVSVGTSHAVDGIDFNYYDINGLNVAKAGQPFKYDLEKLRYYERLIDSETVIIVPVSFHSFCLNEEEWLPHEVIYNYKLPLLGMSRIITLRTYITTTGDEFARDNNDFNEKHEIIIPAECNYNESIDYLEKIVMEHKNVVLITTPYLEEYLGDDKEFIRFYETVNELCEKYNLEYLDYSRDYRFQNSYFFNDATHLNSVGRRIFTPILISDLNGLFNN